MDKLFLAILNMSLTGAFVIAAICVARLPLKKAPKIISYCLWAVAGFRLVFPYSIESVFSLIPFKAQTIPPDIAMQPIPRIDSGIPFVNNAVSSILPAATPTASVNPLQIWTAIGAWVWIIGVAVMLIYGVVSFFILKRKMRGTAHVEENIHEAENIKSPFVLGVFAPKIYLPIGLSEQEKSYIILHEQTHIKRHDHIVKFVAYFVLCLHWFNPLAWVAFLLMGVDMEMSCDERVLKEMGGETKKAYSLLLLSLATERRIIGGSPLAFGEGGVKERIKNVLNFKKPSRVIIVAAVALVVVLSVGFAVNKANSASPDDNTSDEIPTIYANAENGSQVELVRFGYSWILGDLSKSEQQMVEVDALAPFQYEQYNAENTMIVGDQAAMKLSTNKEKLEKGYVEALSYTIWKPDGTVYDDGRREVYDSLSLRVGTDKDGNIVLFAPFETGEYIYGVNLKFERGTVIYGFKVIVSFVTVPEAQEIVSEHYPEATEIRYTGQKDISYTNPPAPVDVYTFEVDVNGETIICAVSTERGIYFTYSNDTWWAFTGLKEWSGETRPMTLADVRAIAEKIGTDLTIGDLRGFIGVDIGSGLYIPQYPVENGEYYLTVGAGGTDVPVLYAYLARGKDISDISPDNSNAIDIRYYDVDKFIADGTRELVRELPESKETSPLDGNPFSDQEVAAAKAVVEKYFNAWADKDEDAWWATWSREKPENSASFGDWTITLKDIRYNPQDPMRESYVKSGGGSINNTPIEDVIVFKCDFNVHYPDGIMTASWDEGDYTDWSVILVRQSVGAEWFIADNGY